MSNRKDTPKVGCVTTPDFEEKTLYKLERIAIESLLHRYYESFLKEELYILKSINITLRFVLEISSLILIGYGGFIFGKGNIQKIILMFISPLLISIVWALFGAPKAPYKLPVIMRSLLIIVIYIMVSFCLVYLGKRGTAIMFIIIAILNSGLLILWKQ